MFAEKSYDLMLMNLWQNNLMLQVIQHSIQAHYFVTILLLHQKQLALDS